MDRTNDVREIAEEIAKKKNLHKSRVEIDRKIEKDAVTRTASDRKKEFDRSMNKRSYFPIVSQCIKIAGVATIVALSTATLTYSWKTVSEREVKGVSDSGVIINPYNAGAHAKAELSMIDKEIAKIADAASSSDNTALKPIISGSAYDVLSIIKSSEGTSATVEFIREGFEPAPVVFNWNAEGTLLEPKY